MSKRIAVITDATSAEFWFPKWYQYYANEFGPDALHIITYRGHRTDFKNFDLGGLWDVPHSYDDGLRARLVSKCVDALLVTHDVVVRCDVDEFLIPDLRLYRGLRDYICRTDFPYVTAFGIDVFERENEFPIDMSKPILVSQRQYGIANTPLHKIAITSKSMDWAPGFHAATSPPQFDALYMFHMKFADVEQRAEWFQLMRASVVEGGSEHSYFSFTEDQMRGHKAMLSQKPVEEVGWACLSTGDAARDFLSTVTRWPSGFFQGDFAIAQTAFKIPEEFRGRV